MKTPVLLTALVVAATAIVWFSGSNATAAPTAQSAVHDVAVTSIERYGPSAVNLSDTNGRYMWVVATVANNSDHTEMVNVSLTIEEDVPLGCVRAIQMIIPGQPSQLIQAGDEKAMIWRVRYECHSPAAFAVVRQTVEVGVTHCDPSTSWPGPITSSTPGGSCPKNTQPAGAETNLANNVMPVQANVMVR